MPRHLQIHSRNTVQHIIIHLVIKNTIAILPKNYILIIHLREIMIIVKSDSTERKTYKRLENLSQKERSRECACAKQGKRPTELCDMYSRKKERKSDENKWRKFKYSLTKESSKSSNILFMLFFICIRSIKEGQEKIQWNISLFMRW